MERIGRYRVTGRLGRGGMGTVYKARAPVTDRVVALKILRPRDELFVDLVGGERLRRIFLEEAKVMGSINHDHVAKILDCGEEGGAPYIILEYFAHSIGSFIGEAYAEELPSRIISVPRTYRYVRQALKGLERLHFAGIIHRDIKPYNLMITNDDRVKLIDFGLSRVRGEKGEVIPGMQIGSPYYAAPEQQKNPEMVDGRADIYSLGVLLYRMLTGRLIDPGLGRHVPPSHVNPVLDSGWDGLVERALALLPEERYEGPLAMRLELDAVYRSWLEQADSGDNVAPLERVSGSIARVRATAKRIMYKDICQELGLDVLFRPDSYCGHRLLPLGPLLLRDPATGLVWQRCGSGFTLDWPQAKEYIGYLNNERFGGRANWRLPTTAELVTVLRPPSPDQEVCLEPHFEKGLHWLWSADHSTRKHAWMADILEGYIGRLDMDGTASVCAVATD